MDFLKICRACTSERTNLLNLFANDCDDEPTLGEKFFVCTSLDLFQADDYPQHICYSCAKQLETAYKFRKQCERSYKQMQKRLLAVKDMEKSIKIESKETKKTQGKPAEVICVDDVVNLDDQEDINSTVFDDYQALPHSKEDESVQSITVIETVAHITDSTDEIPSEGDREDATHQNTIDFNVSIEERPYQCNECGKSFFTTKALALHTKLSHKPKQSSGNIIDNSETTGDIPCFCEICDSSFKNIDRLRMHKILKHGPKPLKCNICGQSIRNRIVYKKHLLSHKNSGTHNCNICGKQYTNMKYLQRHMLYHQETVYRCEESNCERIFNVKHKFVNHIRLYHNRNLSSEDVRQIQPILELQVE